MQTAAVALIVGACLVYAVWALMPGAVRRRVAVALLALPCRWPVGLATELRKAALRSSGCGCDGCDKPQPATHAEQPLAFHPRPKR